MINYHKTILRYDISRMKLIKLMEIYINYLANNFSNQSGHLIEKEEVCNIFPPNLSINLTPFGISFNLMYASDIN